jgi:hypothetical protein
MSPRIVRKTFKCSAKQCKLSQGHSPGQHPFPSVRRARPPPFQAGHAGSIPVTRSNMTTEWAECGELCTHHQVMR